MTGRRNREDDNGYREDDGPRAHRKKVEYKGIRSLTISEIKGTGQEVPLFRHYTIHD
jgi:hypothetical protein